MREQGKVTEEMIAEYRADFQKNTRGRILKNAIVKNGIQAVALDHDSVIRMQHTFSHEIKTGKITSQSKSGRCWLFAGLNTLRQKVSKDFKIEDFEFSQNYPMFWDKLEKANYFLENILENLEEDIYNRVLMWLLADPVQDGGQWDMFAGLVEKYGVVPKHLMPETFHSTDSPVMNRLLTQKLREDAAVLRKMHREGRGMGDLEERKAGMVKEIYSMLAQFLGEPPQTFDFEYRDKDEKFHEDRGLDPRAFFRKYVDLDLNDYISVINAPTGDKPFKKTYTVKYLGNIKGGKEVLYLNVDHQTLKDLAAAQLKEQETVWFGCDVSQMTDKERGILDAEIFRYQDALGIPFNLDKAGRLDYGDSKLTHAMVFTGVNLVDGKPDRWKVENSWGEKVGEKGYFVMSNSWFDQYNYQVVVRKKYLSAELKAALEQEPIVLAPWDPMGALALMR